MSATFRLPAVATAAVSMLVTGCAEPTQPAEPSSASTPPPLAATSHPHAGPSARVFTMMDACDPETFNGAFGAGTCVDRGGGVTLDHFIAELTRNQKVGGWFNAPMTASAATNQTLLAFNQGGEVHTFTRVDAFGGGFIPFLNDLSGTPDPAPECLTLDGSDFIPAGGTHEEGIGASGTHRFQCCIHPWMRSTVHVR